MNTPFYERRLRRSDDTITALHLQLSYARFSAGLDALVLVDEVGALVAGAGAWPVCEELAAFAPLLADTSNLLHDEARKLTDELRPSIALHPFSIDGTTVLLAARGALTDEVAPLLTNAASGCTRILQSPS
ncbi:MAG: hypothetical protein MUF34_11505 [Polyangiaceae bacterium]|jgi:hypothetical protein|nr:hypothetical protein [Polyangiaceae bacterium]